MWPFDRGGVVLVLCKTYSGSDPTAAGGTGGIKGPGASIAPGSTAGAAGSAGRVFKMIAS